MSRAVNPIQSKLLGLFGKKPPTIVDEAEPYNEDTIAHGHERGYEPGWKEFSKDPHSPRVVIRRQRGRKAKHPI